jgi:DNA segregation ATPase FtsK/SpoIIIE and related proteins
MDLLLTIADPTGEDHDVSVSVDSDAPVEELARALADAIGSPNDPPPSLVIERTGQPLAAERPVGQADLRFGDRIILTGPAGSSQPRAAFELLVTAGAGAGRRIPLAAGASVQVGRDPSCELALDDERVSRRHLHIGAGSRSVQVTDLGSSNGTYVDGERIAGTVTIRPGQVITVGSTTLTVRSVRAPQATDAAVAVVDGRLAFAPPPRIQRPTPSPVIALPRPPEPPPPRRIPMVASLLPVALGLVMAYFLGPIMLLFAAMGPVMLLGTVWEDKRTGRRDYAKARKAFEDEMAALESRLATTHEELVAARRSASPDPATLSERVRGLSSQLWERRPTDRDFATLRIGIGDRPSALRLDHDPTTVGSAEAQRIERLLSTYAIDPEVPVDIDLRALGVIGITGDPGQRAALLRWLVVQGCTLASPRDLALVVLAPDGREWTWTRWLPHAETLMAGLPGARSVAFDPEDARLVFGLVDDLLNQRRAGVERSGAPAGPWRPQVLLVLPGEAAGGGAIARSALSRVLAEGPTLGITAIVSAATAAQLPGECKAVVDVVSGTGTTVTFTATGDTIRDIRADGIDRDHAADLARRLAPVHDSSAASATADVPRRVLLLDLLQLPDPTADLIAQRWQRHAATGDLAAPVGASAAGPVSIDLRRDGPHGLTAGTTGAGKSELLQSMIGAFAATYPANRLTFVLIDYKGGAAFKDCVDLPHTVGFFTDLDAHLARRALTSLNAELRRREHILREHGAKDIIEMEQRHPDQAPANLFLIIDEFAFLKKEVPEFVAGIIDIAQRGRSLGVHLMLATQRPTGVIDDNIRANTNLRIALRVADESDSSDILDRPDAARIPKSLPGRGLVRTGHSDITVMQSAYANARSGGPSARRQPTTAVVAPPGSGLRRTATGSGGDRHDDRPTDLQRLVTAIRTAHENLGVPTPPRPWLDPLPAVVTLDELPGPDTPAPPGTSELAAPIGRLDQPSTQAQPPGWLDLGRDGHVLIYGTGGAGKTQALRSLAVSLASRLSPADLHLYGLDFGGGGLRPLAALPHTGGVVTADERERVDRLLALLDALIARRRAQFSGTGAASLPEYRDRTGDRLPYVVVLVDGYGAFHQAYLNIDRGEQVDTIARLVAEGRGVGVLFVLTADRRNTVPATLTSAISTRLVLRMADGDEYASLGLPLALAATTLPPGRGFLDGTEIQIGVLGSDPTGAGQAEAIAARAAQLREDNPPGTAPTVSVLAEQIELSTLDSVAGTAGAAVVALGRSGISDATVRVDLDDIPVFGVFGPDRSGRTTTLATLVAGLTASVPDLEMYLLAPRRSALTGRPGWTSAASGPDACAALATELADLAQERVATPDRRWLIVIDDGDELADSSAGTALTTLMRRGRDAGAIVLCAVQTHVAHRTFGGWITDLRKAKHGLLLRPEVEVDGDLFGLRLPQKASRRFPVGRGYLVVRSDVDYVQVALAT